MAADVWPLKRCKECGALLTTKESEDAGLCPRHGGHEDPQSVARELGVPKDAPAIALLAAASTSKRIKTAPARHAGYVAFVEAMATVIEVDVETLLEMPVREVLQRLRHKVVEG